MNPAADFMPRLEKKKISKTFFHFFSTQTGLLLGWKPKCFQPLWISSLLDSAISAALPWFALLQFSSKSFRFQFALDFLWPVFYCQQSSHSFFSNFPKGRFSSIQVEHWLGWCINMGLSSSEVETRFKPTIFENKYNS